MEEIHARVMNRLSTEAEWLAANPVILKGEIALTIIGNFVKFKIGIDGTKTYSELPFNAFDPTNFRGTAIPTDNPGVQTTEPAYWLTVQPGTYTNFGGIVVNANSIAAISWTGASWVVSQTAIDFTPINNRLLDLESNVSTMYDEIYRDGFPVFSYNSNPVHQTNVVSPTSNLWIQKGYVIPGSSTADQLKVDLASSGTITLVQLRLTGSTYNEVHRESFDLPSGISTVALNIPVKANDIFGISGGVTYSSINSTYYSVPLSTGMSFSKSSFDAGSSGATIQYQVRILAADEGIIQKLNGIPNGDFIDTSDVISEVGKNLFDKSTMAITGGFVNNIGGITTNSVTSKYALIPIQPGTYSFKFPATAWNADNGGGINFYDSSNALISYTSVLNQLSDNTGTGKKIVIPSGVSFMAINLYFAPSTTLPDQTNLFQIENGSSVTVYEAYDKSVIKILNQNIKDNIARSIADMALTSSLGGLSGKLVIAIGDSMVSGNSVTEAQLWLTLLANQNKMSYINYGIDGNFLTTAGGNGSPVVTRYSAMTNAADYVLVFIGTNDAANGVAMGTDSSTDPATFKGALNILCDGLQTKYPGKKIGFITPYSRTVGSVDYINAIESACLKRSIPVFNNMKSGGVNFASSAQASVLTLGDTYHLNASGMVFATSKYNSFIRSL